ncbi:hypothetical protein DAI22_06g286433 [Oryza sativa Japonica Group]|nr:hypothetical protein DAI22_06g286433 [Oryza sativa Japonica Group]
MMHICHWVRTFYSAASASSSDIQRERERERERARDKLSNNNQKQGALTAAVGDRIKDPAATSKKVQVQGAAMANYHHQEYYQMAAAAAVAWPREPDSPQLSIMSGCSSLFSISTLRDDDDGGGVRLAGAALPATPVSLAGIAGGASTPGGDEVDMEVRQQSGGSGDDRRTIRMMRNRESALRSRRARGYVRIYNTKYV